MTEHSLIQGYVHSSALKMPWTHPDAESSVRWVQRSCIYVI